MASVKFYMHVCDGVRLFRALYVKITGGGRGGGMGSLGLRQGTNVPQELC